MILNMSRTVECGPFSAVTSILAKKSHMPPPRELAEETGIIATLDDIGTFRALGTVKMACRPDHYYYRLKRAVKVPEMSIHEGAGFAFLNDSQLKQYNFVDSASLVLEYLHRRKEFAP